MSKMVRSKKKVMLASLDELADRMPSLLDIDHSCARKHIAEARQTVEVNCIVLIDSQIYGMLVSPLFLF